jgi:peptide/nickel transport system substrate-binding protein
LWIQPTEAEGGFDPRTEARGTGPWLLKDLRQSAGIEFVRNPNWYGKKERPFLDGVQFSFLADYAASIAQFKAKNAWTGNFVRKEDVLGLKREAPEIVLNGGQFPRSAGRLFFGVQDQQSPFKDERVRQAVSMSMDRDLVIDVFDNVKNLSKEGLVLETRWNSPIAAGWDGVWLDPQSKEFGPNGKYYSLDVAEAKKLMSAAGFANGFECEFRYTGNGYDSFYRKQVEVMQGVLAQAGVRPKMVPEDYTTVFLPGLRNLGVFNGVKFNGSSAQGDPLEMISAHYHSEGGFGIHQPPFSREPDIDQQSRACVRN